MLDAYGSIGHHTVQPRAIDVPRDRLVIPDPADPVGVRSVRLRRTLAKSHFEMFFRQDFRRPAAQGFERAGQCQQMSMMIVQAG